MRLFRTLGSRGGLVALLGLAAFAPPPSLAQTNLTIVTGGLPGGVLGRAYSASLTASGGAPPYTWTFAGTIPPGLQAASTGVISGTPTTAQTYSFSVSVVDSAGNSASKPFSIAIAATGSSFSIGTTALPAATAGQPYSATLTTNGGTSPYTWTLGTGLPASLGLTLNSNTGQLSGTPAAAGSFTFNVQATDAAQNSATATLVLTVTAAPLTVTTVGPLFSGAVGSPYSQTFTASGGQPPYSWTVASGSLPPGLSLAAASGTLAGTPQSPGTFTFAIQVSDGAGAHASQSFSVTVNAPTLAITVGAALPAGTVGASYSQTLPVSASGGTPPYTWSLSSGTVPGLSFNPGSLNLSGIPNTAGTFAFVVQVTDGAGLTATRSLSVTINPASLSIAGNRQLPDASLGQHYQDSLTASGGLPPYRWSAAGLPSGLTIDSSSGQINGTPAAAGNFPLAITVTDSALSTFSDRFTLNVNLPSVPEVLISGLPATVGPAQQFTIPIALASTFPVAVSGQAILTFSPDSGPGDTTIQFSTGGTVASFNIAAGNLTADAPLSIQTGTVSGTITISLRLQAGGIDITPSPAPSISTEIDKAAPVIRSVQVNRSGNTLSIVVTGYSTAREVTQAVFAFTAASGQTLQSTATSITQDVSTLFGTWFFDSANSQFGTVFIYTQPFTIQGDVNSVIPVSVTLTNRIGSTTANAGN